MQIELFHCSYLVIPKLTLKMNPEYDFSILRGEEISLQCTVTNTEALLDVTNGSLVMTKDGSALPGQCSNTK